MGQGVAIKMCFSGEYKVVWIKHTIQRKSLQKQTPTPIEALTNQEAELQTHDEIPDFWLVELQITWHSFKELTVICRSLLVWKLRERTY